MSGWDTLIQWDKAKILTIFDDSYDTIQVTLGRYLIVVEDVKDLTDVEEAAQKAVDVLSKEDRIFEDIAGAIAQLCESRGWKLYECADKEIECYG